MRFFLTFAVLATLVAAASVFAMPKRHSKRIPTADPTPKAVAAPKAASVPKETSGDSSWAPTSSEGGLLLRILQIEDRRGSSDRTLVSAISHSSSRVRRAALHAIGRIKDTTTFDTLLSILNRKKGDNQAKKDAAFALGLIGNDTALKILQQQTQMQTDSGVLAAILFALGRGGNEGTVPNLAGYLREDAPPEVIDAATRGIGLLWSGPSDRWAVPPDLIAKLVRLAGSPDRAARAAAFALSRFKGDPSLLPVAPLIDAATRSQDPAARALLCRALGKTKAAEAGIYLVTEAVSGTATLPSRLEAIKALGAFPPTETGIAAVKKTLEDAEPHLQYEALDTATSWGTSAQRISDTVEKLYRTSPSIWIKGTALRCLTAIDPKLGRLRMQEVLNVPTSPLLEAAVASLALTGQTEDLEKLVTFIQSSDVRVAEAAVEGISQLTEDRIPAAAKPALRKALEGGDTALSSLVSQLVERYKWKEFAPSLAAVYPLLNEPDEIEAKVAVLNALSVVGDHSHLEVISSALSDPERLVVTAAVNAKKAISGNDESAKIPQSSKVTGPVPTSWSEVKAALDSRVAIKTNRGEIVLKMVDDTPLTAFHFVRFVKQGFYNGKTFHRVVPNFVVQGGDPHGDGYGGPGFLIRDELSPRTHSRGTVGIATAGPDTGGCQFFFNLAPNLHLDAKYTLFAEVTSGMEYVDQLEPGDRIISARVIR